MDLLEQSITDGSLSAAQPPVLLDIEASSLASASYPIEVAWALSDGGIESHLISPASVPHWTDWHPQAERLHGIRRELLLAEGKSPAWVCTRMNEQLAGLTVFSDAPAYDEAWLQALFAATWKRPSFRLSPISFDDWLLEPLQRTLPHHAVKQRFAELRHQARHAIPLQHRAHGDVQYLRELWRRVMQASA